MKKLKQSMWTIDEINYVKENATKLSVEKMANNLNRSVRAVRAKLNREGVMLNEINGNPIIEWTHEEDVFLKENFYLFTVNELAKKMNRTTYAIRSRKHKLGLNNKYDKIAKNGGNIYVRNANYIVYYDKRTNTSRSYHRILYEKHYGIKLTKEQIIHHLDGNKKNNNISNLLLTKNMSEHRKVHAQLEAVAFQLYKEGFIKFDKNENKYVANSNRRLIKD